MAEGLPSKAKRNFLLSWLIEGHIDGLAARPNMLRLDPWDSSQQTFLVVEARTAGSLEGPCFEGGLSDCQLQSSTATAF